jgi:polyisoprenoid-binding protein YceI
MGIMAVALSASGAQIQVHLPPESTTVDFTLKATMHTVHGTATLESAEFTIDSETGAASGEAVVISASADTDNGKRDKKMHSKVLLSSEHQRIVIRAERIEGTLNLEGASEITLVGAMEILGAEHPIRVPMTVTMNGDTATVEATFSVPYVEWGLKDPSTFILRVGKEVPVTVKAENITVNRVSSALETPSE